MLCFTEGSTAVSTWRFQALFRACVRLASSDSSYPEESYSALWE